jgi:Tol biopolymer transport system component
MRIQKVFLSGILLFFFIVALVYGQSSLSNPIWKITKDMYYNYSPLWNEKGDKVYFISNRDTEGISDKMNIFYTDSNGFNEAVMVPIPGFELYNKVEFSFFSGETKAILAMTVEGEITDLYVADVDSSGLVFSNIMQITNSPDEKDCFPVGTKDGSKIYFSKVKGGSSDIWSYTFSTGEFTKEISSASMPDLNPDESWLLYVDSSSGQIYQYQPSTKTKQQISNVSGKYFLFPRYSADGKKIISSTTDGKIYLFSLFTTEAQPTLSFPLQAEEVVLDSSYFYKNPYFSPSAGMILFSFANSSTATDFDIGKASVLQKISEVSTGDKLLGLYPSSGNSFYYLLHTSGGEWDVNKVSDLFNNVTQTVFTSEEGIYNFNVDKDENYITYLKNAYYGNELWMYDRVKDRKIKLSAPDRATIGGGIFSNEVYFFKYDGQIKVYQADLTGSNLIKWGEFPSKYTTLFDFYLDVYNGKIVGSVREGRYQQIVYFDISKRETDYLFEDSEANLNRFPMTDTSFKNLIFVSGRQGGFNLWMCDLSTKELLKLTQGNWKDMYPIFIKNGIIFERVEAGSGYLVYQPLSLNNIGTLKYEIFQGDARDFLRIMRQKAPRSEARYWENYHSFFGK